MTIGERIKKIRQENGLSQKELGRKLNVSQQMIGQWETGKSNPKIETLRRIADTLEVRLFEIVDLDEMDSDTIVLEITKMMAQLSPEGLKEFDRLLTESLNEIQESSQKEPEKATKKAPKFYTRDEKGNIIKDGKPPKFTTASRSHAQTEAYELFHSLLSEEWAMSQEQETTAVQLKEMLGAYNRLNNAGRKEAVKRVDELTEIPRYTKPDESPKD